MFYTFYIMGRLQEQLARIGTPSTAATAVLVKGDAILMGYRHYTPDKWKSISVWNTPGGRCDEGETLEATLRREIREEVDIDDLRILDFIGEAKGVYKDDTVPIFFCSTNQDPKLMEPEKFSEWRWVPISEYLKGGEYQAMNPGAHRMISDFLKKRAELQA